MEIEQFVDLAPTRALSSSLGRPVWYGATQLQSEIEYGITDHLELGLYVTFVPNPGEAFASTPAMLEGNGSKQRLRLRLAEEGEWPVDTGLYLEVVENQREIEVEAKILLHRRVGPARFMVNLSAEHEFYFTGQRDWVVNPTGGVSFEVSPTFQPGVEAWMFAELPTQGVASPRPFALTPHVYCGPTAHLNLGKLWMSAGAYLRLDQRGRSVQPGDTFSSVWMRGLVGVEL
jgi:hypothetical protein